MHWSAIILTLRLALIVCMILLAIGMPIAYWITYTQWRWRFLAESVVALPLVLPPTVLGFYLLVAMGPQSPVGRLYESWMGQGLPFTFAGLVAGSVLYSLPFTVQPMVAAFALVDPALINASAILGLRAYALSFASFCHYRLEALLPASFLPLHIPWESLVWS